MIITITVTLILIILITKGILYIKYLDRLNKIRRDKRGRFAKKNYQRIIKPVVTLEPIKVNAFNEGTFYITR